MPGTLEPIADKGSTYLTHIRVPHYYTYNHKAFVLRVQIQKHNNMYNRHAPCAVLVLAYTTWIRLRSIIYNNIRFYWTPGKTADFFLSPFSDRNKKCISPAAASNTQKYILLYNLYTYNIYIYIPKAYFNRGYTMTKICSHTRKIFIGLYNGNLKKNTDDSSFISYYYYRRRHNKI